MQGNTAGRPVPASDVSAGELFGHPKGLYVLFFTEMWERFSFYSMRAFLVLYMTKALLFSERISNEIYGAYLGFVYASTFVGGMLADRLLGQRRSIVIGGTLMAAAQFSLATHALLVGAPLSEEATQETGLFTGINILFFLGMGMLSAGNGFFKPNISTIVGTLYERNDPRRDGAFTIFYMGINIGAMLAAFSGQIAETVGWHWGFILAGSGMVLGQVIFFFGKPLLGDHGLPPTSNRTEGATGGPGISTIGVGIGVVVFIPLAALLMARPGVVQDLAIWIAIPVLAYLLWESFRSSREDCGRMIVIIVLCCFSMMFWGFFELAGSTINLFADEKVDRTLPIFGEITASFITAFTNAAFIIILGMPFAKLWVWLNKRSMEPSSPFKFALGLAQLGAGFWVMYLGALQAGSGGKCSIIFLALGFLLHTTGELCLSPVGLSTVTKLSPPKFVGMFMGVWFLASALGNVFAGIIGGWTEAEGFAYVFRFIGIVAVGAGVLLFLLTPPLKKMMFGVK
ncbi:MAG: peptide MFS transporter [Phycisphaerae bacterium]|nr:peptide MFS transporter [Phycisphaerae bacterium]